MAGDGFGMASACDVPMLWKDGVHRLFEDWVETRVSTRQDDRRLVDKGIEELVKGQDEKQMKQ
jgi:hypothetical protein